MGCNKTPVRVKRSTRTPGSISRITLCKAEWTNEEAGGRKEVPGS